MARQTIVLAAKRSDAQAYARQTGTRQASVLFASSRHTIASCRPALIVELPSFQNHRGRHGILETVKRIKRSVHGGVEHIVLDDFDAASTELAGQTSIDDFLPRADLAAIAYNRKLANAAGVLAAEADLANLGREHFKAANIAPMVEKINEIAAQVASVTELDPPKPKPVAKKRAAPKVNLLDETPVARDERPARLGAKGVSDDTLQRLMDDLA